VKKGDTVAIYMPNCPECAYSMLAVSRIGAIHSVVFGGFSAESLSDRIRDASSKVVITADEGIRGGKTIPLKKTVDEAVALCPSVKKVFVFKRGENTISWYPERDIWLHDAMVTIIILNLIRINNAHIVLVNLWIVKILFSFYIPVVVLVNQKVWYILQQDTCYMLS
jgi:hypothetical protein